MTLVELVVAMAIGLGVTLAITTMLIAAENHKRTTTSVNDAEQTGAYAFHAVNRLVRGAGSAIVESDFPDRGVFGCRLNAAGFLPRNGTFPAPFAAAFLGGAGNTLRTAPILIGKNQSDAGSDVLVVMGGSGAAGGVARQVTNGGNSTSLNLDNTAGFVLNDLVLVSQNGTLDCLIEQATGIATPTLTFSNGAPYYTAGNPTSLTSLAGSTATYVTPLGNATANNVQFVLIGVGANNTLYVYDLLQNYKLMSGGADVSQAIADGVSEIHAIYGVATNAVTPGVQNSWAGPSDAGYDINTVMNTPATMAQIVSVRIALVLRSEYADKNPVSPATLTWFNGLKNAAGVSLQQSLNVPDRNYRYRIFEFTVPLRNVLLLATA